MSLIVDSSRYRDIRFGDSKIDKVFLGSQLIWKRNSAPSVQLLSPAANATGIAGTNYYATDKCCVLSWSGSDPDNDTLTYTCYLGTSIGTMSAVYTGTATSVSVNVKRGTTYYWKVTVKDSTSATGETAVRTFTTSANHLPTVTLTYPAPGTTLNPSESIVFKYTINDSDSPTDTLKSYIVIWDEETSTKIFEDNHNITTRGDITKTVTYPFKGGKNYLWEVYYTDDDGLMWRTTGQKSFKMEGIVGLQPYSSSMPYGTTSVNYGSSSVESAKIWAFKHPDGSLAALIGAIRADNNDGWAKVDTFSSDLVCSKLYSARKYLTKTYTGNIKASNLVTHLKSVSEDTFKPYYNGWTKGRYLVIKSPEFNNHGGVKERGQAYGPYLVGDISLTDFISLPNSIASPSNSTYWNKYLDTLSSAEQNATTQNEGRANGLGEFSITSTANSSFPGTIRIQGRSSAGALGIFCLTFYGATTSVTPPSMSTLLDAFNSKYGSYQCWNA